MENLPQIRISTSNHSPIPVLPEQLFLKRKDHKAFAPLHS